MYNACKAKFQQNPNLMSFLRDTKGTKLIEANKRDKKWSCGLGLDDKNLFNEASWLGKISVTIKQLYVLSLILCTRYLHPDLVSRGLMFDFT